MKYKIQNTSTTTTVWVENAVSGNAFPLSPGEKVSVPETSALQVIAANPDIITNLGPVTDNDAPAVYNADPGANWVLVTIGPGNNKFYTIFKISASAATAQISFSGWNSAAPDNQTAPPAWSIIDVPVVGASVAPLEFDFTMNPTNSFYVKRTTAANITVIAY
jgi:hypothetical protein